MIGLYAAIQHRIPEHHDPALGAIGLMDGKVRAAHAIGIDPDPIPKPLHVLIWLEQVFDGRMRDG